MKAFRLVGEIKAILFKCNIPLTGSNLQNLASTEIQREFLKQKNKLLDKTVETSNLGPQMSTL